MRSVLVTGAAGGLGGATCERLLRAGWQVFAADVGGAARERYGSVERALPIELDVTDRASVAAAAEKVRALPTDGLDGIVNFAGVLALGSMVELDEETLARVLEVNVLGTYRVNKAFFPLVLARRGRIVNISSEAGWQSAPPFNGAYAMSKHAIEAYSDALRRELMFLGVRVITVQPGPFRTPMVGGIEHRLAEARAHSTHFAELLDRTGHLAAREGAKARDPALLARVVHEALASPRPRVRYSVKPDRVRSVLSRLPASWADAVLRRALKGRS